MGMKFACQHLLRRRDLSCTKVNAVNRLSNCLDASFRLSRGEAAPPATAAPRGQAPHLLSSLGQNWPAGRWGQNKWTQLSRPVSVLSK